MAQTEPRKEDKSSKNVKAPVVKSDRDLSVGYKTGKDLTAAIKYNDDPTQIPKDANVGAWSTFQRYAKDYKFGGEDSDVGSVDMNSLEGKTKYTDRLISDFNSSPEAAKYKAQISKKDIENAQRYHSLTDPNVAVDGWYGSQAYKLNYPSPVGAYQVNSEGKPVSDKGYLPYKYGSKDYVLPASKVGKFATSDLVPYDPSVHGSELQRGSFTEGRFQYTPPTATPTTNVVAPSVMANPSDATITPTATEPVSPPPIEKKAKGGVVGYVDGGIVAYNASGQGIDRYGKVVPKQEYGVEQAGAAALGALPGIASGLKKPQGQATPPGTTPQNPSTPTTPTGDTGAAGAAGAAKSAGMSAGAASSIAGVGSLAAGIGASAIDSKNKDARGRYTSTEAAVGSSALKGAGMGAQLGMAAGPQGALIGAGIGAVAGAGYGLYKGDKDKKAIDTSNKKMASELATANTKTQQQRAMADRDAGVENRTSANLITKDQAMYDENDNLINPVQYAAKGGTIVGKGGPKSDSIFTNSKSGIKPGSFIVPAENNSKAKAIRGAVLGDNPNEMANFKKGGETNSDIAVSNGEHLFTPSERKKIVSYLGQEILEELAPNAEENKESKMVEAAQGGLLGTLTDRENMREYKKGGLTSNKAKMMLHDGTINGKPITDAQRKYFGWVAGGSKEAKAEGGDIFGGNKDGGKIMAPKMMYADGTPPKGTLSADESKKLKDLQDEFTKLRDAIDKGKGNDADRYKYSQRIPQIAKEIRAIQSVSKKPTTAPPTDASTTGATTTRGVIKGTSAVDTPGASANSPKAKVKPGKLKPEVMESKDIALSTLEKEREANMESQMNQGEKSVLGTTERVKAQAEAENKARQDADAAALAKKKAENKSKLSNALSGINTEALIGAGQAALGYNMLKGEKRPGYKFELDPAYQASVERQKQDASYGLSAEQRAMANQDIANALSDTRYSARNFAGGNAGTAFGQETMAINEGWRNKLGLITKDQELKMAKQQISDQSIKERAGIMTGAKRQAYEDAMGRFLQIQQGGSDLVGAGIRNVIGSTRLNKELEAMKAAKAQEDAYLGTVGTA